MSINEQIGILNKEIRERQTQIKNLQESCSHPWGKVVQTQQRGIDNWGENSTWTLCTCAECGKSWEK
jgi:hypothetical protein